MSTYNTQHAILLLLRVADAFLFHLLKRVRLAHVIAQLHLAYANDNVC